MAYQPKSYRKFLATGVTAAVVASAVAPVGITSVAAAGFSDVPGSAWYAEAVNELANAGVFGGVGGNKFNPTGNVTNAQAYAALAKALQLDEANAPESPFSDAKGHWAENAINALYEAGIIAGDDNGKVNPDKNVTREQLTAMLIRALGIEEDENATHSFTDVPAGHWAEQAIATAVEYGITNGVSDTEFGLGKRATRAELAGFLYKETVRAELPAWVEYEKKKEEQGELQVSSLKAINGKQLEVKFSHPVLESTVITGGNLNTTNIKITSLDDQTNTTPVAKLSKDGKTLTITATGNEKFEKRYSIVIQDVTTETGEKFDKYTTTIDVKDTTRPTLVSVKYSSNGTHPTAVFEFSEPIQNSGFNFSFKRADGKNFNGATTLDNTKVNAPAGAGADNKKLEVVLDAVHSDDRNVDIVATLNGVTDYAGNVITPNPQTYTIKYLEDKEGPKVQNVTVKSNNTLEIKFDKALRNAPTSFTLEQGSTTLTSSTIDKDSDDETLYTVTFSSGTFKNGPATLSIPAVTNVWGHSSDATTRLVNIQADTAAPVLQSSRVQTINGVQYLVLTYNEDVETVNGKTVTGTYLKDYVTQTATIITSAANFAKHQAVNDKSKVVRLNLSGLTEKTNYTLELPRGLVTDAWGNESAKTEVQVNLTGNVSVGKPKLVAQNSGSSFTFGGTTITVNRDHNGIVQSPTTNDVLYVLFDKAVDGASALNKSNYKIEGATVKDVKIRKNASNEAIIEIEIEKDSATFTGNRQVTISGVKSQVGVEMDSKTTTLYLTENVRPTVEKAELTGASVITLTFSENVDNVGANDFEVYVGGTKHSGTFSAARKGSSGDDKKKVEITLQGETFTANDLAQTITVKAASTTTTTDEKGNKMNLDTVTVKVN